MKLKSPAFTLLEMVVAVTISGIFLSIAFGTVGQIYFSQKRIQVQQNFYSEARFLLDRIVQDIRNSTIDYDEYFEASYSTTCTNPHSDQGAPTEGYPEVFYWDFSGTTRNLGGLTPANPPVTDPCTEAFTGDQDTLYLINGSRNTKTTLTLDANEVKKEVRLGRDTDNDGKNDAWGNNFSWDGSACSDGTNTAPNFTINTCNQAHSSTAISPKGLIIDTLTFQPAPTRDPFLAWAVDEAQIHPHVVITMTVKLADHESYGFAAASPPTITLTTAASSRVFGNARN